MADAARYTRRIVRSAEEVRHYLMGKGTPAAVVEEVLRACLDGGVLDDAACARLWADHWGRQGFGWVVIRERLEAKGLSASAIAAAERELGGPAADEARARAFLGGGRVARRDAARLAGQLAGRGFDSDVIERLVGREGADA